MRCSNTGPCVWLKMVGPQNHTGRSFSQSMPIIICSVPAFLSVAADNKNDVTH